MDRRVIAGAVEDDRIYSRLNGLAAPRVSCGLVSNPVEVAEALKGGGRPVEGEARRGKVPNAMAVERISFLRVDGVAPHGVD